MMLPLPKPPKIIKRDENIATFEIEALYPGYGVTVGNALRRVLYSSLPGAAITQVKFKGVQHEFSTLPHVLEDVLTICLNLKQLRFKVYADTPQAATLKVKGEREVRAKDFKLPSQVEIVNREASIATLTDKKAALEMEIQIEKGLGYQLVEARRKVGGGGREKLEIGQVPLDAIFTPVRRVKYSVENMRVGERTDFDRLLLEIETDGTITPEEAFGQSSEILIDHFSLFSKALKPEEKKAKAIAKKGIEKREEKAVKTKERLAKPSSPKGDPMALPVADLKISSRTVNILHQGKIKTVGGLINKGEPGLMKLSGMGEKGMEEIKRALKKLKLAL